MHGLTTTLSVILLIGLSAVCSGLNVAFMSLDLTDLRRKAKLGNPSAKRIMPLRRQRHLVLAAILLTNVAAVAATSLVLESVAGGIIAGLATTLLIVVFGEIIPQAYFARHSLAICARLTPVMRTMIFLTYPAAKPIQIMLDSLFGNETPHLHSRQELGVIITEHVGNDNSELDEDEVEIIRGALQLSEKRVGDIMTSVGDVYWLTPEDMIDQDRVEEIKRNGHSRIPVFNQRQTTCYGVLLVKDLIDINFEDNPQPVDDMPLYPTQLVGYRTALDTMFRRFIKAGSHLMPIEREDHIVGIVTIEDLLEEIIGHEIEDESDRRVMAHKAAGRRNILRRK